MSLGGKSGLLVRGTILKTNPDGTVDVAVDSNSATSAKQSFTVPLPLAFTDADGSFIGGVPSRGTSVILSQGQGQWYISSYIPSNKVFNNTAIGNFGGLNKNLMGDLIPGSGRLLLQTKNAANKILLDPKSGILIGTSSQAEIIDPKRSLISHNFQQELSFTAANRSIIGPIKRDIKENSIRNITGSILDSPEYNDNLFTIGLDPSTTTSTSTTSTLLRNLPLTESHEIIYEFQNYTTGLNFTTDNDESDRYLSKLSPEKSKEILRTDSRTNVFNLNLNNPNHLIEEIKGTGVDIYGNILNLNRDILPIGKTNELSLTKNSDSQDAFAKLRAQHRKALAYHWEINSRKGTNDEDVSQVPDPLSQKDYARDRSRTFIDFDKEGQFNINISASSETGNVGLLTRYENASTLLAAQGDIENPLAFVREDNNKDIFHDSFANFGVIKLSSSDGSSDGYIAPVDRFTDATIKLGTAYHDITKTIKEHQENGRGNLINYFTRDQTYLNRIDPVEKVVSDNIFVSGQNANAGGRSGTINLDGHLSLNIGAETANRQSLWIDCAGGIVSNIGRDKFGHSFCGNYDGDVLMQIGSTAVIGDSRFSSENNSHRGGTLDLRVVLSDGQLCVVRIDGKGLFLSHPGRIEIQCQQDMVFRSNSNIMFEGKNCIFYPDNLQARVVKRSGVKEI